MPVTETERFLVNRDSSYPDKWVIHPLEISELWRFVLGDDWDITYHEHPELDLLFDNFRKHWERGEHIHGDDILICEVVVHYSFTVPPGAKALRHGRHCWSEANEFWYMVGSASHPWKIVGGIVRTINMVSIERSHVERRPEPGQGQGREVSRQASSEASRQASEGTHLLPQP